MKNTTVLLVEDDANDEVLILRALNKNHMGNQVFVARDGVEALDFLLGRTMDNDCQLQDLPQLTMLDLGLP
jgi:two-component system response regulator